MSEEVTRHCDFRIQERRKYRNCGERVPGDQATEFSVGEEVYLADLCGKHQIELSEALAPFVEIATLRSVRVGHLLRKALVHRDGSRFKTADARRWLQENGYPVSKSGVIREDLLDAYRDAYEASNK